MRRAGLTVMAAVGLSLVTLGAMPAASGSARTQLERAVKMTLAASSMQVATRTSTRTTSVEEYIAPNRVRVTFPDLGGMKVTSIIVGDIAYNQSGCDNASNPTPPWSSQQLTKPVTGPPSASVVAALIRSSTDVRRVATTDDGARFRFSPGPQAPPLLARLTWSNGTATTADGRLREVSYDVSTRSKGKVQTGHATLRFSRYGAVEPIEAPPADQVGPAPVSCTGSAVGTITLEPGN